MNSRKPIVVMIAAGGVITAVLSYIPYSIALLPRAEEPIVASSAISPNSAAAAGVAAPPAPAARFDVAGWYAAREEEPERHGVLIESLDGKRVFASHNADTNFNPASLVKLATTLVALRRLGADYHFETRVLIDGDLDSSGVVRGKILVGGADPTFGDVAANMIARELKARGVKKVTNGIVVSPDFCFNFSESAEESAKRLRQALRFDQKELPIEVSEAPRSIATPSFVFRSYPLHTVLLYMNAHSSNFVAERIGALIGGPDGVRRSLVEELGLAAEQVLIARVSGRESNQMTPRGVVAVMRALAAEAARQGLKIDDLLPIVSRDYGTLRTRLRGTPLEAAALAKTGTLTAEVDGGMASLTGLIYTKDAGPILFAILDQGNRISKNRQMQDHLLIEVITSAATTPDAVAAVTPRQLLPPSSLSIEGRGAAVAPPAPAAAAR